LPLQSYAGGFQFPSYSKVKANTTISMAIGSSIGCFETRAKQPIDMASMNYACEWLQYPTIPVILLKEMKAAQFPRGF
jgi:hypothetical protein